MKVWIKFLSSDISEGVGAKHLGNRWLLAIKAPFVDNAPYNEF